MVAAIQTSTGTFILVINGAWVWNSYQNGFRMGDSIRVQGYGTGGSIDVVSMTHVVAGGAGGAAGSSGTGGAAGAVASPGTGGPAMVRLPEGFFIDSTEVTRGQYEAWLATNPATSNQTADCTTNTTFAPDAGCMGDSSACQGEDCNRPQACVDWCDAFQYCKAVGKRLCGNLAGDATKSEWSIACSANGRNLWVSWRLPCSSAEKSIDYAALR
jgi:formylglycine-generating enzyme required for sulfatase activity